MKSFNQIQLIGPQENHVQKLLCAIRTHGFGWDFSGTGTGKTYCGASVASQINAKHTIVICPKIVIPSWRKILDLAGVKDAIVINYEKIARGNTKYGKYVKSIDPRTCKEEKVFHFNVKDTNDIFIIFDEAHKCKGKTSLNSELMLACKTQNIKHLCLSATMALSFLDMWVPGYIVGEHNFRDFNAWCLSGGVNFTPRGHAVADVESNKSRVAMKNLHDRLFGRGIANRMSATEFGSIFPENRIFPEIFDMGENGDKIASVYEQMEYELAMLEDREYADHIFAIITRARRRAELLKVPTFIDLIVERYDEGFSCAAFVNYVETIEAIKKGISKKIGEENVAIVMGGQSSAKREEEVQAFQSNKKRIILCNISAGGVGVSLHDLSGNHPRVSFISPNYSGIQFGQALGRIWRAEAKSPAQQYIVFCAKTIEEEIAAKIHKKLNDLDALNDGDLSVTKDYGLVSYESMGELEDAFELEDALEAV